MRWLGKAAGYLNVDGRGCKGTLGFVGGPRVESSGSKYLLPLWALCLFVMRVASHKSAQECIVVEWIVTLYLAMCVTWQSTTSIHSHAHCIGTCYRHQGSWLCLVASTYSDECVTPGVEKQGL